MSNTIAFIPARCGSKGIKLKNIKSFCGQPLIYWNIKALMNVDSISTIVVATDCDEIEKVVKSFNFNKVRIYRRSKEHAQDNSSTESVMLEYIDQAKLSSNDIFILVQLTSPTTRTEDYDNALSLYNDTNYDSILSCARIKRFFWSDKGQPLNYDYNKRPRRQDFKGQLVENGALYISSVESILKSKNRLSGTIGIAEMPEFTSIEIDEEDDWIIAEALMQKHILKNQKKEKNIKLVLSDVDGVLTDSGMYYSEKGDELKKFSTYDGKAVDLLHKQNILFGIITGENTKIVENRANKIKSDFTFQGIQEKLPVIKDLCEKLNISLEEVAYIGDDLNDLELLQNVGYSACPSNAREAIKSIPDIIHLQTPGGSGALREFVDHLLDRY